MAISEQKKRDEEKRRREQTVEVLNGTNRKQYTFGGEEPPAPPPRATGPAPAAGAVPGGDVVSMLFNRRQGSRVQPNGRMMTYDYDPLLDRSNPQDQAAFRALLPTVVGQQAGNWRTGVEDAGQTRRTGMQEGGATRRTGMQEGGAMDRAELSADVARGGQNIDALKTIAALTGSPGGGKAEGAVDVQYDEMNEPTYITERRGDRTYVYPHTQKVRRDLGQLIQAGDTSGAASYLGSFTQEIPEDMRQERLDHALNMIKSMTTPEQQRSIVDRMYGRGGARADDGGAWYNPFD